MKNTLKQTILPYFLPIRWCVKKSWLFFMRVNCLLIRHSWTPEPIEKGQIKATGKVDGYSCEGIQKGKRNCRYCQAIQQVYRKGTVGFGGPLSLSSQSNWRPMLPVLETYIDSLPIL